MRDREQQRLDAEQAARATAGGYGLRVAIFREEARAAEALTRLLDAGYDGTLVSGGRDGALVYELLVGPYPDLEAARDADAALAEVYGYDPTIILFRGDDAGSSAPPESAP
jgi:cell division septation protein DedD